MSEKITTLRTKEGYVVVAPDPHSGWKIDGNELRTDLSLANVRAAAIPNACVLTAAELEQLVECEGSKDQRRKVMFVDWQGLLPRVRGGGWYAIRVQPGFQRMAAPIAGAPEYRLGETIIERHLREAGLDVYMPAFWVEVRVRRKKRFRTRRLPLLVGYAFVRHDPGRGFEVIREVDGVNSIVSLRDRFTPSAFREEDIGNIMLDMFRHRLSHEYNRIHRIEEAKEKQTARLMTNLGRAVKGRNRTSSLKEHAAACMESMPTTARQHVQGIIDHLDALQDDEALDEFREPVYISR
ncbi:transcription termination/antitermination NusG family protein [Pararhizobium gei]|uniref:transcription termination/antitermination NusG family protein n=1 Tax=Pararhizobium gei TaxID=1395951 RepID=UPI0023DC0213|nr:transcription termination/antitermination NusG family protein [Rhizobium gei]